MGLSVTRVDPALAARVPSGVGFGVGAPCPCDGRALAPEAGRAAAGADGKVEVEAEAARAAGEVSRWAPLWPACAGGGEPRRADGVRNCM